MYTVIYLIQ